MSQYNSARYIAQPTHQHQSLVEPERFLNHIGVEWKKKKFLLTNHTKYPKFHGVGQRKAVVE